MLNDARKNSFQQDGATPHTANLVQDYLTDIFGDLFIRKIHLHDHQIEIHVIIFHGAILSQKPLSYTLDYFKADIGSIRTH
jgi:hypothetical protein